MNTSLRQVIKGIPISGNMLAKELTTMSRPVLFKYLDDPQKYTLEQLVEIAVVLRLKPSDLLIDLDLI